MPLRWISWAGEMHSVIPRIPTESPQCIVVDWPTFRAEPLLLRLSDSLKLLDPGRPPGPPPE